MTDEQALDLENNLERALAQTPGSPNAAPTALHLLAVRVKRLIEATGELTNVQRNASSTQSRQQWFVIALTAAILIATAFYTVITYMSIVAMRDANNIQRQMLDVQKDALSRQQTQPVR